MILERFYGTLKEFVCVRAFFVKKKKIYNNNKTISVQFLLHTMLINKKIITYYFLRKNNFCSQFFN